MTSHQRRNPPGCSRADPAGTGIDHVAGAFRSGARDALTNRGKANHREGHRDRSEIEPHAIAVGSLRALWLANPRSTSDRLTMPTSRPLSMTGTLNVVALQNAGDFGKGNVLSDRYDFVGHRISGPRAMASDEVFSLVRKDGEPPVIAGNGLGATHEIGFADHSNDMAFVVNDWRPADTMCQQYRSNFRHFHVGANGDNLGGHDICCVHAATFTQRTISLAPILPTLFISSRVPRCRLTLAVQRGTCMTVAV